MFRRAEDLLDRSPARRSCRSFITQTVSAMPANDAEIVGDEAACHAEPRAGAPSAGVRICACTVTSSAVVGSSAIKQVGLVGQRHRDHHALALAAGQLVRIAREPRLRLRGCRPGSAASSVRAARGLAGQAADASSRISPICVSIVCSGLSEVIGSWKMMVMSLPRHAAISSFRQVPAARDP